MLGKHALGNKRFPNKRFPNKQSLNKQLARMALVGLLGTFSTLGVGCAATRSLFSPSSVASGGDAIILTDVDFDPDSLIPETQPVADYLGSKLGRAGISKGEVNIAPDVATVAEWMESGEVNLYFDSVYPAMLVMEQSGAKPILRRWKDGVPEYGTFFVARADSGLSELDELQGKMITLQEPSSSSGFMFPMVYMLEAGLNPVEKAEPNHTVAEDEVGYVFSGQEDITIEWILDGRVIAGAVDDETWADLSDEEKSQLSIIAETDKFPRHMVLAGPKLTPKQIETLQSVMTGMDNNRAGKEALEFFSETAQFDEFPEGAEAEIARLAGAYELLQSHLASPEATDLDEEPAQ
ncbi:MAG: phosphate/phosphite/phosphonate ABC transporter substrate-binding protein [Cyanobacteria bacterium P01_F01_bin.53]